MNMVVHEPTIKKTTNPISFFSDNGTSIIYDAILNGANQVNKAAALLTLAIYASKNESNPGEKINSYFNAFLGSSDITLTGNGLSSAFEIGHTYTCSIEAPAVIGEIEQPVNVTPNDADFLTRASIKQLANTEFVRNPETGLYVAEDSGELVKSVNKDLIINPQKNFEIQQSAPLSAADIQALLSIDPDNLGGKGDTKV